MGVFLKSGVCRTPLRSAIANCTNALAAALTSGGFRGQGHLCRGIFFVSLYDMG